MASFLSRRSREGGEEGREEEGGKEEVMRVCGIIVMPYDRG
jgi:hypothetical protein